jgi:hypothetical protein
MHDGHWYLCTAISCAPGAINLLNNANEFTRLRQTMLKPLLFLGANVERNATANYKTNRSDGAGVFQLPVRDYLLRGPRR